MIKKRLKGKGSEWIQRYTNRLFHKKLITSLRTATDNGEGSLDKEATSHDDCLDAFRLSLMFWH